MHDINQLILFLSFVFPFVYRSGSVIYIIVYCFMLQLEVGDKKQGLHGRIFIN